MKNTAEIIKKFTPEGFLHHTTGGLHQHFVKYMSGFQHLRHNDCFVTVSNQVMDNPWLLKHATF